MREAPPERYELADGRYDVTDRRYRKAEARCKDSVLAPGFGFGCALENADRELAWPADLADAPFDAVCVDELEVVEPSEELLDRDP